MNLEAIDFGMRTLLAILAGGIAYYMLGALWYMKLFGERWIAATGRTKEEIQGDAVGAEMLLTLAGAMLATTVLAVVFQWGGGASPVDGAGVGLMVGVGVAAAEGLKQAVYNVDERVDRWALYGINSLYAVMGLTLAGVVYALIA
ncbi:MAG: DUF1761 domain-containing protein [Gemmatimonadota bacterium]